MKILEFEAPWCAQCKAQAKLSKDSDLPIEHINVDENDALVEKYGIKTLPTMVFVDDDSREIKRFIGITPLNKLKEFYAENNKC